MGYFSPGAYGGLPPGGYGGMIHPAALALHSILSRYGGMMNPNPGGDQGYWTPERMAAARPMNMAPPGAGPFGGPQAPLAPWGGGGFAGMAPGGLMHVGAMLPPVAAGGPRGPVVPQGAAGGAPPGGGQAMYNPNPGGDAGYWTQARMAAAQPRNMTLPGTGPGGGGPQAPLAPAGGGAAGGVAPTGTFAATPGFQPGNF